MCIAAQIELSKQRKGSKREPMCDLGVSRSPRLVTNRVKCVNPARGTSRSNKY
jgi:hypothetical protein